jgi:predicted kinase
MRPDSAPSSLKGDTALLRQLLLADARSAGIRQGDPKLLMVAGLPGSGKSTFAAKVNAQRPFLTLETDRLRKALVLQPQYTPDEHSRVFRACHILIDEFIRQGYPVLFDATNLTERNRKPIYAVARKRRVPLAVVVIAAPSDVVRQRLEDREAGLDPETWSDAGWEIHSLMAPAWERVKRPHILVDSSTDTAPALNQVLEWANS